MNKKKKTLLSIAFVVAVVGIGLYGVDLSEGYLRVSELNSTQIRPGAEVNVMGIVKTGTLDRNPGLTSFELKDEEDANSSIRVEYKSELPSNVAEGKKVSISGTLVSENILEAKKIVTGCPSKYTE
ncbi:MAG: cytochrome c maturation protein CcmE [Methanosarcinaceae archaeon]|nr:cytochrome c maturation protein CcmE [Methanosarcinaceae archaeon]MDD4331154.1 cytochrome c maturation protein CcmE [Methanosarcinaceae archaeon]MDD4749941.1 cytochrome c maturation protein CcmE [Methanosarcinaceae archaeon]